MSQGSCCDRILGTIDRGEKQLALPLTCRRAVPKNVAQFGNQSALERPKGIPGTWAPTPQDTGARIGEILRETYSAEPQGGCDCTPWVDHGPLVRTG